MSDIPDFFHKTFGQGCRVQTQFQELFVLDDQFVYISFEPRVWQIVNLSAGKLRNELRKLLDAESFGNLVEDKRLLAFLRRVLNCQFDTADSVADVDECSGLAAAARGRLAAGLAAIGPAPPRQSEWTRCLPCLPNGPGAGQENPSPTASPAGGRERRKKAESLGRSDEPA